MADLKIFTENIEHEALNQIYTLIKQPAFSDCKIRIMPDVHAGAGCVIGFTADLGEKVIPNIVGVDIGCGMLTTNLGNIDIDFERLDNVIRKYVPSGRKVHEEENSSVASDIIEKLYCKEQLKNIDWLKRSCGTLGGGNHFIEVDSDSKNNKYLVIHSGSRNVGKQVAEIYQRMAIDDISGKSNFKQDSEKLIAEYKKCKRERKISKAIKELKQSYETNTTKIPSRRVATIKEKIERSQAMINKVPIWEKVTLTIDEAAEYSNIGVNKLREITNNPRCQFVMYVGKRRLIKRKEFEKYIAESIEI